MVSKIGDIVTFSVDAAAIVYRRREEMIRFDRR